MKVLKWFFYFLWINIYSYCNVELLNNYGFKGSETFINTKNNICPIMKKSCCTHDDINNIYNKFYKMGEFDKFNKHFETYNYEFLKLIENLMNIKDYSKKFMNKARVWNSSLYCRLMARKIIKMDYSELYYKIKQKLLKLTSFLLNSHKGFYCSICDYDWQNYFSIENKQIVLNDLFCSKLIINTINILSYKIWFLPDIIKLNSYFLTKCNYKFFYKFKKKPWKKHLWNYSNYKINLIRNCIKFSNENNWLNYCKEICQNFNPLKLNKYFTGDLNRIFVLNKFYKSKINVYRKKVNLKDFKILNNLTHINNIIKYDFKLKNRVLTSIQNDNILNYNNSSNDINNFLINFKIPIIIPTNYNYSDDYYLYKGGVFNKNIINNYDNDKYDLNNFKTLIVNKGIDIYIIGLESNFENENFKKFNK